MPSESRSTCNDKIPANSPRIGRLETFDRNMTIIDDEGGTTTDAGKKVTTHYSWQTTKLYWEHCTLC